MSKTFLYQKWKNALWSTLLTILCIVCFPANPLVLTGVIEVELYLVLFIMGWVVWAFGMVLVMAPIVMFPRRGGVPKGKSFVNTTALPPITIPSFRSKLHSLSPLEREAGNQVSYEVGCDYTPASTVQSRLSLLSAY